MTSQELYTNFVSELPQGYRLLPNEKYQQWMIFEIPVADSEPFRWEIDPMFTNDFQSVLKMICAYHRYLGLTGNYYY